MATKRKLPQDKLKVGQKGKYTPEKVEEICKYIRLGMTNVGSCHLAHISETTYYEWIRDFPQFAESIKEAEEKAEASDLAVIYEARKKSWAAAAWRLERRFPERYSLVKRHELSGPGGRPVPIAVASVDLTKVMTLEQLEKLAIVLDQMEKLPDESGAESKGV